MGRGVWLDFHDTHSSAARISFFAPALFPCRSTPGFAVPAGVADNDGHNVERRPQEEAFGAGA